MCLCREPRAQRQASAAYQSVEHGLQGLQAQVCRAKELWALHRRLKTSTVKHPPLTAPQLSQTPAFPSTSTTPTQLTTIFQVLAPLADHKATIQQTSALSAITLYTQLSLPHMLQLYLQYKYMLAATGPHCLCAQRLHTFGGIGG